jgi:hypothetical protein
MDHSVILPPLQKNGDNGQPALLVGVHKVNRHGIAFAVYFLLAWPVKVELGDTKFPDPVPVISTVTVPECAGPTITNVEKKTDAQTADNNFIRLPPAWPSSHCSRRASSYFERAA